MTATPPSPEAVAAARAYEDLFVGALFGPWARRTADAASPRSGDRALDVATGTGAVARTLADRMGDGSAVTGLDAAEGMLAVAAEVAPSIDWRLGTADDLPFPDARFDVVTCQFGLMFFPDRVAALREMARVLAPGGRLAVTVWGDLDANPAMADEVALLDRLAGAAAAGALRAPFALGDADALEALAHAAGVGNPSVTALRETAVFPSIRVLVEADLRGWLPLMGVDLDEATIVRVLDAAEVALERYRADAGTMRFQTSALLLTGSRR